MARQEDLKKRKAVIIQNMQAKLGRDISWFWFLSLGIQELITAVKKKLYLWSFTEVNEDSFPNCHMEVDFCGFSGRSALSLPRFADTSQEGYVCLLKPFTVTMNVNERRQAE